VLLAIKPVRLVDVGHSINFAAFWAAAEVVISCDRLCHSLLLLLE